MLLKNVSKKNNTSGQGADTTVPEEIAKKFNWGAMMLGFLWGPFNKTYITLTILFFAFIPIAGLSAFALAVFFGVKGNEWAWKNKEWESVEQFNQTQKKWAIAGVIWVLANIIFEIITKLNS